MLGLSKGLLIIAHTIMKMMVIKMNSYEFSLTFKLANNEDPEQYVEPLGMNCDDSIIGIGTLGLIGLTFDREADSAIQAVISAIKDIRAVIPHATLIEAQPDLVGLSDFATLMGCSRQYARELMQKTEGFPAPVHAGKSSIWHLSSILKSLPSKDQGLHDLSEVTRQLNIARELAETPVKQEFKELV